MSINPATGKRTFIAWCPDYADEGAFSRRMSVRPAHLEGIQKHVAGGYFSAYDFDKRPESDLMAAQSSAPTLSPLTRLASPWKSKSLMGRT